MHNIHCCYGKRTTFVLPYWPKTVTVSKYLIYMAALESNNSDASFINLADWTSAYADITFALAALSSLAVIDNVFYKSAFN